MKAHMVRAQTVVGGHVYGRRAHVGATVARVKAGLHVREFDALRALLKLSVEDLARRVGISVATLSRRRRRGEPLDVAQRDRIMRFARLYRLATDLYDGNQEAARTWLTRPARALEGQTPLDFAETEAGAREVESL